MPAEMVTVAKSMVKAGLKLLGGSTALKSLAWRAVVGGKTVLVIGCSTGANECRRLVESGCREVHGVDIAEEIGSQFTHPLVTYFKMSAESLMLESNRYDIVYCQATLEHVPGIKLALKEAVRVTRPRGFIYCVASPLWHSMHGHHQGHIFGHCPWIHLRLSEDEILDYCRRHQIRDPNGSLVDESTVRYMLNEKFFNKLPARAYLEACNDLPHVSVLYNQLEMTGEDALTPEIYSELEAKGFTKEDLLATTHRFLARKRA